ncbi:MAG TPA: CPBP family intramembrane glutamic endopeptidase [Candidatus Limnocylindrales bacterium]|nr:CPBP family intramembrane glutamic endopeptidase [Candidatus Limnocylindrales bacterium]
MTSTPTDPPEPSENGTDPELDLTPAADPPPAPPSRPGLTTFTIEGRAAPGLFVVGWLATIVGIGLLVIGALGSSPIFFYFVGPLVLTIGLVAGAGNQALERRARGAAYAGPSPYLVFATTIAASFAAISAVGLVLERIPGVSGMPDYVASLLTVLIQAGVFLGVLRLTVVGTDALSWAEMGWRRFDPGQVAHALRGAAIALPVIGITSILAGVLVRVLGEVPESPLPPTGTNEGLIIQLIAGALIAPIAEEAVFRGFAVTAWQRTVGETGAIVRASLLFALAHVINAGGSGLGQVGALIAIGFLTRVPVAFALGWIFVRTRSIWAPIGLHMAFNAILLVLADFALRSGAG